MSTTHLTANTHSPQFKQQQAFMSGEQETFATVLVALALVAMQTAELMEWDPDVLSQELKDYYKVDLSSEVRDKMSALIDSLNSDRFYRDPLFFNLVANSLSGDAVNMEIFEPADIDEIAWAVLEVGMNDHEDDPKMHFDPEVEAYVGAILQGAGLKPFPPLEWAKDFGQEEGFDIPDDPGMVGVQFDKRISTKQALLAELEHRISLLHDHLRAAGLSPDRPKPRQDTRRTLPT